MRFVWLLLCKCARLLADLYLCTILPLRYSQASTRCKLCCCQSRNWIRCGCYECVLIRVLQSHIVRPFFCLLCFCFIVAFIFALTSHWIFNIIPKYVHLSVSFSHLKWVVCVMLRYESISTYCVLCTWTTTSCKI